MDGPGGDEFRELIEMRNRIETDTLGTDALSPSTESIFPHFISNPQKARRHFVVRDGGRIVGRGLTSWLTAADAPAVSVQEDTLVLRAHRGKQLGMLLKASNAQYLLGHAPDTAQILTFHVEENEPMLRVNIEMGFEPIGAEGEWQKRI